MEDSTKWILQVLTSIAQTQEKQSLQNKQSYNSNHTLRHTLTVRHLNTPLSPIDRPSGQKLSREKLELINTIDHKMDLKEDLQNLTQDKRI